MILTHVEMMRTLVELASSLEAASRTREATALRQAKVFIETVNIENKPAQSLLANLRTAAHQERRLAEILDGGPLVEGDNDTVKRFWQLAEDLRQANRTIEMYRDVV